MPERSATQRSITHATFTIERHYDATPARVFRAWADPAAKARWFGSHDNWKTSSYELDFRVGGRERLKISPVAGGVVHAFDGIYQDIVPDQRIIYSYDMHLDDRRISVSLATVELTADDSGTRLIFTEQAAFLDGQDNVAQRKEGTQSLLDGLGRGLA